MRRITDRQFLTQHAARLGRSRVEQSRLQKQIASGRRVSNPSDDPTSYGRIERIKHQLGKLDGTDGAASTARAKFDTAERSLDSMFNSLIRVKELTVQSVNFTLNAGERVAMIAEIRELQEQFEALSATRYDGQYVFSGTRSDTPPLDNNGDYQGGGPGTVVEVGDNTQVDLAIDGSAIFDDNVNVMQVFSDLITNLQNNDTVALGNSLDEITSAEEQVIVGRTEIGARLSRVQVAEQLSQDIKVVLASEEQDAGDTDVATAISELMTQERSLQAAVQIAGRSLQPSLLDIL